MVDLVEVHAVRLGEPVRPQHERGDHEDEEDPQVQPVEPAAALPDQERRPVVGAIPPEPAQPADDPQAAAAAVLRPLVERVVGLRPGLEQGRRGRPAGPCL